MVSSHWGGAWPKALKYVQNLSFDDSDKHWLAYLRAHVGNLELLPAIVTRDWASFPNEWAILRPSANGIIWKR